MKPDKPGHKFYLILIKPTHYDDDGYPIQWLRSSIPSNTLACLNGIALDALDRDVLGPDVDVHIETIDETNQRVRPDKIIARIQAENARALIALVGVQSNQFPRAMDLAKPFRDAGFPVCIGGFHASGCMSMLPEMPQEMVAAQNMGISFFLGEAEDGRFDEVLMDAFSGSLKPIYDYLKDMPSLDNQPMPFLPASQARRTFGTFASFDIGRGCPFQCSFCTIINVQGRKSRFRTADDLEKIIRENHKVGITRFFLTDDNLARNKNWESCFDRMIELAENDGIKVHLEIQVDTLCHKIKNFIPKAIAAGVGQVFIGLENINPDNLIAAKKKQNKITDYREMILAWKKYPVMLTAGYIVGFPNDTRESLLHDVEVIKRELALDMIYFTNLTPLPGSEDHQTLHRNNIWMDPDLNKYDLNHRVTHHDKMSDAEWDQAYREMWERYYTFDHIRTILKRMVALGSNKRYATVNRLLYYRDFRRIFQIHPLEAGLVKVKSRRDRRSGMKCENPFVFYPKYALETVTSMGIMAVNYARIRWILRQCLKDPKRMDYTDAAIAATSASDYDEMDMYTETRGGAEAVAKKLRGRGAKARAAKLPKVA